MKKILGVLFIVISHQMFADFIVQNNGEKELRISLVEEKIGKAPRWEHFSIQPMKAGYIPYHPDQFFTPIHFYYDAKTVDFKIPNRHYATILKNAKKYMPIVTVTLDPKTGNPLVDIPQDEKALREATEKAKEPFYKEESAKISKEVSKALPQLPCSAQGAGGITGIIGGYAVQLEE